MRFGTQRDVAEPPPPGDAAGRLPYGQNTAFGYHRRCFSYGYTGPSHTRRGFPLILSYAPGYLGRLVY